VPRGGGGTRWSGKRAHVNVFFPFFLDGAETDEPSPSWQTARAGSACRGVRGGEGDRPRRVRVPRAGFATAPAPYGWSTARGDKD
jgi:hypothetical protein